MMICQTSSQFCIILQIPGGGVGEPGTARLDTFGINSYKIRISYLWIVFYLVLGNTTRCQMFAFAVTGIKTGFNVRANLVAEIKSQAFAITFGMILNSVKLVTC